MKIVIDARFLRTTTGRYIERLLHYLQEVDHQNDYVVLLKPKDMAGWQPTNPHFAKLASPYEEFGFAEQLGFAWQLYRLKPDLVHFSMTHQPILYLGKAVTTVHDLTTARFRNPATNWVVFKIKQQVYRMVIWVVAHKSRAIITPSKFVENDLAIFANITPDKITVIYESADAIQDKAEPVPRLADKQFIVYVGNPHPHKNLRRLIGAFVILQASRPELWLVLVGKKGKSYARHERYVLRQKIKNVVFTGFVSEGQLRWLYENCSAYIFPSLSEGFGLPALEAMAHGAPVASSNATCLPEIYGDGAIYFDPLDESDMAAKIERVLVDEKLRKDLIQAGFKRVKKYSWRRMAEQTLQVYKKALART